MDILDLKAPSNSNVDIPLIDNLIFNCVQYLLKSTT